MIANIALSIGMFMIVFAWTIFTTTVLCHALIYLCLKIIVKNYHENDELVDTQCCNDLCDCQYCCHNDKEVHEEE